MKLAHNLILTWFLLITLTILAACASEGSTMADTETVANDTTTPVLDNRDIIIVKTTNPPTNQTLTITLPAPTAAVPLPTPANTEPLLEPSPIPIFLCPERTWPEKEWDCQEDGRAGVRQCRSIALEPPPVCYEDLFNGFALVLPVDWQTYTTNYLFRRPYRPSNMMVKDHSISMFEQDQLSGVTIIRVFVPQEASLSAWLTNMRRTNPGQVSGTRTEISLGGHPAAIWINDCSPGYYREVHVAVHNGERVIWWLAYAYTEAGIVGLRQMLDTVRFTDAPAMPVEIPDDIWQEALQGCW
jgi:hypothetical protein